MEFLWICTQNLRWKKWFRAGKKAGLSSKFCQVREKKSGKGKIPVFNSQKFLDLSLKTSPSRQIPDFLSASSPFPGSHSRLSKQIPPFIAAFPGSFWEFFPGILGFFFLGFWDPHELFPPPVSHRTGTGIGFPWHQQTSLSLRPVPFFFLIFFLFFWFLFGEGENLEPLKSA